MPGPSSTCDFTRIEQVENLHERANCINDWSWTFRDKTVDMNDEVVAQMRIESEVALEVEAGQCHADSM
jgi:hypothetical protein